MSRPQRRWSAAEDAVLQKEVQLQSAGIRLPHPVSVLKCSSLTRCFLYLANDGVVVDWNVIAQKIKGRTNKDCRKRYYNGIAGGLKKVKPFSDCT